MKFFPENEILPTAWSTYRWSIERVKIFIIYPIFQYSISSVCVILFFSQIHWDYWYIGLILILVNWAFFRERLISFDRLSLFKSYVFWWYVLSILLNDTLVIFLNFLYWSVNTGVKVECVGLNSIQIYPLFMQKGKYNNSLGLQPVDILCDINHAMVSYWLNRCFCTDLDVGIECKDVWVKVKNLWFFELVVHVRVNQIVSYFDQVVVKVDMTVD